MPIYVVTYDHPDEEGWRTHLMPHLAWLRERVADGSLLASGPLSGEGRRAMLLIDVPDRAALDELIASDPFAVHDLIADMTVREWDPIFGTFSGRSSMPALGGAT